MAGSSRTLQDLIDQAMTRHKVTSTNALAKIGKKHGYAIVNTTLSQIRAGTYPATPKKPTIAALAFLAGVPYEVAHEAAGLGLPRVPYSPPEASEWLTPKQRRAIDMVINAMAEAQKAAEEVGPADDGQRYLLMEDLEMFDEDEAGENDPPASIHNTT